eukprot:6436040-Prymnesium_polylepis.2
MTARNSWHRHRSLPEVPPAGLRRSGPSSACQTDPARSHTEGGDGIEERRQPEAHRVGLRCRRARPQAVTDISRPFLELGPEEPLERVNTGRSLSESLELQPAHPCQKLVGVALEHVPDGARVELCFVKGWLRRTLSPANELQQLERPAAHQRDDGLVSRGGVMNSTSVVRCVDQLVRGIVRHHLNLDADRVWLDRAAHGRAPHHAEAHDATRMP